MNKLQMDRPGFLVARLVALMRRAIDETGLNLSGMKILTEGASGAYGVTPVIAAMAGAARVYAFTRSTAYGSSVEIAGWVSQLASAAGVAARIDFVEEISSTILGEIDIVTNSGHLRPITRTMIASMPHTAVIALMFEAWEFRPEDIDLDACRQHGIPIVGVNERHKAVDVFSFLGPLCAKELHDCGLAVCHNKVALVCDNEFSEPVRRGLVGLGASVEVFIEPGEVYSDTWDAVVIALLPGKKPRIGDAEASHLAGVMPPEAVIVQFWGDIDRGCLNSRNLNVWPPQAPKAGHMAVLLSDIGPEAIVRLQAGGLRAAESIRRGCAASPDGFSQIVEAPWVNEP